MYLTEEDAELMNGTIKIMTNVFERIRELPINKAREDLSDMDEKTRKKYARKDRKDTKYFDIIAEDAISIGDHDYGHIGLFQKVMGKSGVIITEECGRVPREIKIEHDTPVIISDPVDGSSYLDDLIERLSRPSDRNKKLYTLFERKKEEVGPEKIRRHACNSSATFLRDNMIKYTVIMNLFTGDIYIGSPYGVFMGDIENAKCSRDIKNELEFFDDENMTMLCYNKEGKYEQNRKGTHLRFFPLHPDSGAKIGPIGPMRFTNLVDYHDKSEIGIVAHNGEKIQEILPNIAIALFSGKKLQSYKLFCDPEYTEQRAGKEMTPNLANSLYSSELLENSGVNLSFLNNYDYPSEFRDTTAIISSENDAALTMFEGMVKRKYATRIV